MEDRIKALLVIVSDVGSHEEGFALVRLRSEADR